MKTYIVTEKDLERLQETFSINNDSWWYNVRVDEWEGSLIELPKPKKLNLIWDIHFNSSADLYVEIKLDEYRTEFYKFIEDNNFIKPEQPYYVKDGEIFDYSDLRELFLESRNLK